jgi:hypothetical protein
MPGVASKKRMFWIDFSTTGIRAGVMLYPGECFSTEFFSGKVLSSIAEDRALTCPKLTAGGTFLYDDKAQPEEISLRNKVDNAGIFHWWRRPGLVQEISLCKKSMFLRSAAIQEEGNHRISLFHEGAMVEWLVNNGRVRRRPANGLHPSCPGQATPGIPIQEPDDRETVSSDNKIILIQLGALENAQRKEEVLTILGDAERKSPISDQTFDSNDLKASFRPTGGLTQPSLFCRAVARTENARSSAPAIYLRCRKRRTNVDSS